jgi:hypothetical protein
VATSPSFCQLCGRKITSAYRLYHHPHWPEGRELHVCQQCEVQRPRCQACGMPMANVAPEGLCTTCTVSLPRCLTCNRPIHGRFVEVDGVSPFCEDCYRERPPCDVCAAPLTDEHWRLSDGRLTCARCHATAVDTPEEAATIYEQMKNAALNLLGLSLNIPTGLALVDRNQLAEIIQMQGDDGLAHDPRNTLGIYTRRGTRRGVYIQSGLPRLLMVQVAAHEFAHAWQGENCPLQHEPLVHEGFAEWVAYKILGYFRLPHRQERMLARTDLYGQGLKWALDLEAGQGAAGVIAACCQAR